MPRIGVIGRGAIGSVLAAELAAGRVPGCQLAGALGRDSASSEAPVTLADLVERSDLVVEAAGHAAVAQHGPAVLGAGVDLMVVSVGALADGGVCDALRGAAAESGARLLISAGAIGGLGLLRAAAFMGAIDTARLTTSKPPQTLIAEWMTPSLVEELRLGAAPIPVFEGTAREAVQHFPSSVNVAATVALATLGFDRTRVTVIADPRLERVRHAIEVEGTAGRYRFEIENTPSGNPRTSAITPYNVLRALADMTDATVVGL